MSQEILDFIADTLATQKKDIAVLKKTVVIDGKDGLPGKDGLNGTPGAPGKDGTASYFTTTLEIRHNNLRATDAPLAHPIASIGDIDSKNTSFNILNVVSTYLLDASNNNVIGTLPDATLHKNYSVSLKRVDNSANVCRINTVNSQTIDGETSGELSQYDNLRVVSNGVNWFIV